MTGEEAMDFDIEVATEWRQELFVGVLQLLSELTSSPQRPSASEFKSIIESSATRLLVAIDAGTVVGMLTLILVRIPTGLRAHIEDVAVTQSHRRRGIGEALTLAAIRLAQDAGVRTIDLTSRPEREAAIRLYERLGFKRRDTGVFRFTF